MKGLDLLPMPHRVEVQEGYLEREGDLVVAVRGASDRRVDRAAGRLAASLASPPEPIDSGVSRLKAASDDEGDLVVHVAAPGGTLVDAMSDESYVLSVTPTGAELRAPRSIGALRGMQTFRQLVQRSESGWRAPAVRIEDEPRFAWRGLLLDSVRRWLPPEVIERNLDAMAAVKLNVLHWHLTDDQGFRIECRRFPALHERGSDGLYYSQERVQRIVELADERGIRVVPEFDMPGHAGSWFVGHPELASAPGPYALPRVYGGQAPTMDPTRTEVYEFLGEFLEEMTELFPDPFVHIGGDEINPSHWMANPAIRAFMAEHGFQSPRELHAHFNDRVHGILRGLGRELVGWDPILTAALPASAVVQSVRGQDFVVDAVRRGHRAIASSEYYLTQMQPAAYHYRRDPADPGEGALTPEEEGRILGGEASMWTEVANAETIDSRTWPRAAAIAERLWSPRTVIDVDDLAERLRSVDGRLEEVGIEHRSGPRRILERMVDPADADMVEAFTKTLRPVTSTARKATRTYTMDVPLDRLVDATSPESEEAWTFARDAEAFVADPWRLDPGSLESVLAEWAKLAEEMGRVIERTAALTEAAPLVEALRDLSEVGLTALRGRASGIDREPSDSDIACLERARTPAAELELATIAGVEILVKGTTSG